MTTALAFLFAFSSGCFLALIRHPIFGLVTYVAVLYVHPPSRWWGDVLPSLRWSLIAAAVTLLSVIIHRSRIDVPNVFKSSVLRGFMLFVAWLAIQSFWVLDQQLHSQLLVLMLKYTVLIALICYCLDTEKHLKYFLWAHAAGCFYLGIVVLTEYVGGRFGGFHGPSMNEENSGAMQVTTGVIITFVLFLTGKWYERLATFGMMPITLNALVATISRSGFLALAVAGVVFNLFSPKKTKNVVRVFSIIGLVLFILITNPVYWERIGTILEAATQSNGEETQIGRLVLMDAQVQMFSDHPLGCGHRCTATLSPYYLEDRWLTGPEDNRQRSSHSTFMSLLVEQGIPGAIFYFVLLVWIARTSLRLRKTIRDSVGLVPTTYTATVAILAAITIGDIFVDYLKYETRIWFIAVLIVISRFAAGGVTETEPNRLNAQPSANNGSKLIEGRQ